MRKPSRKHSPFDGVETINTPRREEKCVCDDRIEYINNGTYNDNPLGNRENDYTDINKNNSSCECGEDRETYAPHPTKIPEKHPIVNLCMPYIESVFFQYDAFPSTNNQIEFNNDKKGRIVKFIYYLDSSMGDSVTVLPLLIKPNLEATNLLNYVAGGNQLIRGTFNSTILEFQLNMPIQNDDKIRLVFVNGSAQDCTIMATCDIKYGEEDFQE